MLQILNDSNFSLQCFGYQLEAGVLEEVCLFLYASFHMPTSVESTYANCEIYFVNLMNVHIN